MLSLVGVFLWCSFSFSLRNFAGSHDQQPAEWTFTWGCGSGVWQAGTFSFKAWSCLPNTWWLRESHQRVSAAKRLSFWTSFCEALYQGFSNARLVLLCRLKQGFLIIRCCGVIMLGFGKEVETSKLELLSTVFTTWCLLDARKSFLAAAVPVRLKGIGGPGAPHIFKLQRRCHLGVSVLTCQFLIALH